MKKILNVAILASIFTVFVSNTYASGIPVVDAGAISAIESGNTVRIWMQQDLSRVKDYTKDIKKYTKDIEEHTKTLRELEEFNTMLNPDLWLNKDFTDIQTVKKDVDNVFSQFADIINKLQSFFAVFHQPDWFKDVAGTPVNQINKINKEMSELFDKAQETFYEEIQKGIGLVDNSRSLMSDNVDWADTVNEMMASEEISDKDIKMAILTGIMRLVNTQGSLESIVAQNANITMQQALKEAEQKEYSRKRTEVLFAGDSLAPSEKNKQELRLGYH